MQDLAKSYSGYNEKVCDTIKNRLMKRFFKYLVKYSGGGNKNLIIRTNDMLSMDPILFDTHEEHILELFKASAESGYKDFFIDIGANIGLSSLLSAEYFERIYTFEPNHLVFNMMSVNVESSIHSEKFQLNNFGIGSENSNFELVIPKHNWGGAFVNNKDNSYDESLLAQKDGLTKIDDEHYIRRTVDIKKGSEVVHSICTDLLKKKSTISGLIKIDVEGMELTVLNEIGQGLPKDAGVVIIFENHDPELKVKDLYDFFKGREVELFVYDNVKLDEKDRGFSKFIKHILRKNIKNYKLVNVNECESINGDLVAIVK